MKPTLALLLALPLSADVITTTYTASETLQQSPCSPDISVPCQPLEFTVPQFAGPGTLTEVDWTFADTQEVVEGIDTMYGQNTGQTWTVTWTGGATSGVLGLDAAQSNSQTYVLTGT